MVIRQSLGKSVNYVPTSIISFFPYDKKSLRHLLLLVFTAVYFLQIRKQPCAQAILKQALRVY